VSGLIPPADVKPRSPTFRRLVNAAEMASRRRDVLANNARDNSVRIPFL